MLVYVGESTRGLWRLAVCKVCECVEEFGNVACVFVVLQGMSDPLSVKRKGISVQY